MTLALLLVVPSAFAAWGSKGQFEPSTSLDKNDGLMFSDAPKNFTDTTKVYFNAIVIGAHTLTNGIFFSPNLATLETAIPPSQYYAVAMLGEWRDCNQDGYVGYGDNGLYEYKVELITDPLTNELQGICPEETPGTERGHKPVHNDGTWVREWLAIGWDNRAFTRESGATIKDNNPFNIVDWDARVWGDFGLPGAVSGGGCYLTSHPRGSFDDGGRIIDLVDCFTRGQLTTTLDHVTGLTGTGAVYDQVKATKNPWGRPSDASHVDAFDCSTTVHRVKVGENVHLNVTVPHTPSASTTGTPAGTINHIQEGTDDCDAGTKPQVWVANAPYYTETDIGNTVNVKNDTDFPMTFNEDIVPGTPNLGPVLGGKPLKDGGVNFLGVGMWGSTNIVVTFNPYVSVLNAEPSPVVHASYYARVSEDAKTKYGLQVPSASRQYGIEACTDGIGAGELVTNGWDCDPAKWWPNHKPDEGKADVTLAATSGDTTIYVDNRVGDHYNLRDVDCYDVSAKHLREAGVHWGVFTNTACA